MKRPRSFGHWPIQRVLLRSPFAYHQLPDLGGRYAALNKVHRGRAAWGWPCWRVRIRSSTAHILVGKGIQPGIYAAPGGARCTWSIFRSGDNNVTGGGKGPAIELAASDLAFHSSGCGMWRPAPEAVLAQVEDRMWLDAANMFICRP